ncbi:AI-2E family transporter [Rhodococcus sp. TAF43]|uniref:AI-2E family transporter n=1 Tax=unclassified Rhodococcus (in: high G+C Gram-positive bacteria) TaxID=192944 RepID=UPI001583CEBC|nr:AI-2E family transporter [Rhodococcus sp. W8901]QKT12581.1 AI-2E family transporter [Rhodococcus sp. W8901]
MARRNDRQPPAPTNRSDWAIPRGLIVLLAIAAGVVAVTGMKAFSGVLGPVFLALMLTVGVQPIQEWVRHRGWPRWIGMLGALVAVYAILLGLVGALAISVAQLATLLPQYSDDAQQLLDQVEQQLEQHGIGSDQIQNALSGIDFGKAVGYAEALVSGLLGVFSNLFFILALLLFMAFDGMSMHDRLAVVARYRPEIAYAIETFASGTRSYLIVSTVFGLIVAVIDGLALWWLGIPLPILWALLSFITNYIPNIGFVLGLIPPALLGLLQGGPKLAIIVIIAYSVINVVIQSVIQPKFVGDAVGLSVTTTFLALVFWGWVLGPLGALLAIPMSLLVKAFFIDIDPSTRWADVFIKGAREVERPPPEEPRSP